MTDGNLIEIATIATILAAVVTILGWLGFTVNGREVAARVWAWLQGSRKEQEALGRRVATLEDQFDALNDALGTIGQSYVTEVNKLKDQIAGLKQRIDEYGQRLSDVKSTNFNNVTELDALSTKQKQLEALVTSREQMLT